MSKLAFKYLLRLLIQKLLALAFFLVGSKGFFDNFIMGYFLYIIALTFLIVMYLNKVNPNILERRNEINENTPISDKILLFLFWIINFFGVYLAAGIFYHSKTLDLFTYSVGLFVIMVASLISTMALKINPFLENTSYIQSDKNQYVVTEGVYKIVRHPTYFGSMLTALGVALIFQSIPVFVVMIIIWIILVIRTYLEDKMLMENLSGYQEYADKVKDRLIPFMW